MTTTHTFSARALCILLLSSLTIVLLALLHASASAAPPAATGITLGAPERVSVGTGGFQANDGSFHAFGSADARYIGFVSLATNLEPEDADEIKCIPTLSCIDVFVRDRQTNTTIRLSNNYFDGTEANNRSFEPSISADGSVIHFTSYADDLVPGDTNNDWPYYGADGFIWRRDTGNIERVTRNFNGDQIDNDAFAYMPTGGEMVYFQSDTDGVVPGITPEVIEIFRRDFASGQVTHIPVSHDNSRLNGIVVSLQAEAAGRYVVFSSLATNVLPNDNNGHQDVYIHDTQMGVTKLVSYSTSGGFPNGESGAPIISADGTHIVFRSAASNLVPNDTNNSDDAFMYNVATEQLERISLTASGGQANGISKDPAVCNGGRLVSFWSTATNIVAGDTNNVRDIFVRDMETGEVVVITRTPEGVWGNDMPHKSRFIEDCSGLLYATDSDNMVANDTNEARDLFLRTIELAREGISVEQSVVRTASAGEIITYSVTLTNEGSESARFDYVATLPPTTQATFVASTQGTYEAGTNVLAYGDTIPVDGSITFEFSVQVSATLTESIGLFMESITTSASPTVIIKSGTIVNGFDLFLPMIARE